MDRVAGNEAKVRFECHACDTEIQGTPEQSLWFGSNSVGSTERSRIFLERAVHDLASKREAIDCGACHRRFMVLVMVEGKTTYRCECGNIKSVSNAEQHASANAETSSASPVGTK